MDEADILIKVGTELDTASVAKLRAQIQQAAGSSLALSMGQAFVSSAGSFIKSLPSSVTSRFDMSKVNKALAAAQDSSGVVSAESVASQKLLTQFMREVAANPGTVARGVEAMALQEVGTSAINESRAHLRRANTITRKMEASRAAAAGNLAAASANITGISEYLENNDVDKATKRSLLQIRGSALQTKLRSQTEMGATPEELVPTIKAINENSKQLREVNKQLRPVGGTIASIMGSMAMGGVRTAAELLPSIWGEHVSRNLIASERAYAGRVTTAGKAIGGGLGSIAGGIIGSIVTGGNPAGAMVGASIGGSTGGVLGGLYGEKKSAELEAQLKSSQTVANVYRAYALYNGRFSPTYANAVAETGLASAADMEKMAANAETLPFRMMFGQVGENEMLMYSLMPEYYAAMMNGASQTEVMQAYKNSLEALPPMLRTAAGSMVGGGSMGAVAYALNPYYAMTQQGAGLMEGVDATYYGIGGRVYQSQSAVRGIINGIRQYEEFGKDVMSGKDRPGIFYQLPLGERVGMASMSPEWKAMSMVAGEDFAVHRMNESQNMIIRNLKSDDRSLLEAQLSLSAGTLVRAIASQALDETPIIIQITTGDGTVEQQIEMKGKEARRAGQSYIAG